MPLSLLLIEDSENDALLLELLLKRGLDTCELTVVNTLADLDQALADGRFDAVISDYHLGTFNGMDAFERIQKSGSDLPFLLVSGTMGDELAVQALKAGVADFITKSNLSRLPSAIEREVAAAEVRRQNRIADELLRQNLKEKEILLAEIHHRVKNNLAIVSSILMLQQDKIEDERYKEVYSEAIHKIKSIALIHEKLYQNKSLAEIEFDEYIRSLADSMASSMHAGKPVKVDVDAERMIMDITTAIPCGLILSELLTNAFKHAFREQDTGRILIGFKPKTEGGFVLRVADDGRRADVLRRIEESPSAGMMIVRGLAEQLGATLTFATDQGTVVTLEK